MTPAEAAVLAAARAYRDAMLDPAVHAETAAAMGQRLLSVAEALPCAAEQPAPTVAASRPWPDPEAYRALACEVFGEAGPPKDVAPAVAAWKALQDGQQVMCSRGYQWTARRADGRLRFTMAKADGRPGKTVEQPWYPCIMARLPVWPIVIEAAD